MADLLPRIPVLSKLFSLLILLLLLPLPLLSSSYTPLFESWCKQHGKTYATEDDKLARFKIFEGNLEFVNNHNRNENATYKLGLNEFSDLSHHEFKASRLGFAAAKRGKVRALAEQELKVGDVPTSIDWRDEGAVTNVKDQGSCGACWSFSATGAMEGINKIVTGSLVSLSEQELVDCDKTYNNGCEGGLMDYAYEWVVKNGGIDTEDDYPFRAADGTCNKNKQKHRVVTIDGYTDVPANNEVQLLQAVAKQPVSVGICGSERSFQLYSKGIFSGPCSTSLDHAVLIVGYGSEDGKDYWIIKNSWGTSWGMSGYMHMLRNSGNAEGICGINMLASYPTKTGPNPPPSPDPSPTKCSLLTYCPAGNTCCCTWRLLGLCLSWSCCDLDSAVCCKDHRYCCPHDYPICDTSSKQCFKGNGNFSSVKGVERRNTIVNFGAQDALQAWNL